MPMTMEEMMEMYSRMLRKQFAECSVPVTDEVGESGEFMMPMDDGVKLRTMYWKPKGKTLYPVILLRSCYPGQEKPLVVKAEEMCRRGFGVYRFPALRSGGQLRTRSPVQRR